MYNNKKPMLDADLYHFRLHILDITFRGRTVRLNGQMCQVYVYIYFLTTLTLLGSSRSLFPSLSRQIWRVVYRYHNVLSHTGLVALTAVFSQVKSIYSKWLRSPPIKLSLTLL